MMIKITWYEFLGVMMTVGSIVSIFWNAVLKGRGLKRDEVEKMIEEKAYPLIDGERSEVEMNELIRKVDKILTNQEIMERRFQKLERDFLKAIGEINARLAEMASRKR